MVVVSNGDLSVGRAIRDVELALYVSVIGNTGRLRWSTIVGWLAMERNMFRDLLVVRVHSPAPDATSLDPRRRLLATTTGVAPRGT